VARLGVERLVAVDVNFGAVRGIAGGGCLTRIVDEQLKE
jgi:hypothetical protein